MPTSSSTKNYVISGKKQVKMFINIIESSSKDNNENQKISYKEVKGEKELRKFMDKWKKNNH